MASPGGDVDEDDWGCLGVGSRNRKRATRIQCTLAIAAHALSTPPTHIESVGSRSLFIILYTVGSTSSVIAVAVNSPPKTTVASGR